MPSRKPPLPRTAENGQRTLDAFLPPNVSALQLVSSDAAQRPPPEAIVYYDNAQRRPREGEVISRDAALPPPPMPVASPPAAPFSPSAYKSWTNAQRAAALQYAAQFGRKKACDRFKLSVNTLKSWTRSKVAVFQLAKHAPKQKRMRHFIKFATLPAMLSAELEKAADEGRALTNDEARQFLTTKDSTRLRMRQRRRSAKRCAASSACAKHDALLSDRGMPAFARRC